MVLCPNCQVTNGEDVALCWNCGQSLKRSWWRRILGVLTGEGPPSGQLPMETQSQGEFDVILQDMGRNKINAIKAVREVTTLGLRDAKELVESAPAPVKKAVSRSEAERAKDVLETAGSTVKVE